MFAWATSFISFCHSPGVAIVYAATLALLSVESAEALVYFAVVSLTIYGVTWYGVLIERIHRANQMIKSLAYENLSFEFFYEANGDFRSRCFFKLRNHGIDPVSELPSTRAFFLGEGTISSIRFRAIDEGPGIYRFQQNKQTIVDAVSALFKGNTRFVEWGYQISPPLRPGDSVSYEVAIETLKTEGAAFTTAGSIMGFPAHIPIVSATLRAIAPRDFKFVCLGHPVVVDIDLTAEMTPDNIQLPDPTLSASAGILDWNIRDLDKGNRYWIKFRLEQELFDEN
jgi:hypothetical protein